MNTRPVTVTHALTTGPTAQTQPVSEPSRNRPVRPSPSLRPTLLLACAALACTLTAHSRDTSSTPPGPAPVPAPAPPHALPFDPTPIEQMARDGDGRIWAIHHEKGVLQWSGQRWIAQPIRPPKPGAYPVLIQTNTRAIAHVLWAESGATEAQPSDYRVTRLSRTDAPPPDTSPEPEPSPSWLPSGLRLTFDTNDVGWLTGRGPRIHRLTPDLRIQEAYLIPTQTMAGIWFDACNPVGALPAPDGSVRFWGHQRSRGQATLRGFLRTTESGIAPEPPIPGLPEAGFTTVAWINPGHTLWAAVPSWDPAAGLYAIDLDAREVRRIEEPFPGAFAQVTDILIPAPDQPSERFVLALDSASNQTLWRQTGTSWQALLSPLDTAPFEGFEAMPRPCLNTADGTWIGAGGNGVLLVPANRATPPIRCDWRRGQPVESVHWLAPSGDGRLVMGGVHQGTTSTRPDNLLAGRRVSPRLIDVWTGTGVLQQDPTGRIWTVLSTNRGAPTLAAWDGSAWTHHTLPPPINLTDLARNLGLDSLGRLWVPYRFRHWDAARQSLHLTNAMSVFDPASLHWTHFATLEAAFESLLQTPASFHLDLPGENQPARHPSGGLCFLAMDWTRSERMIHHHNGTTWQRWSLREAGYRLPGYAGLPFFTSNGQLAINFSRLQGPQANRTPHITHVFDGQSWKAGPLESAGPRDPWLMRFQRDGPQSTPPFGPSRPRQDPAGGSWTTADQQLLRSVPGLVIPQFDADHVHPFIGVRRIDEVRFDARGNVVLGTVPLPGPIGGHRHYVVIAPPDTTAAGAWNMVRVGPEQIEVRSEPIDTSTTRLTAAETTATSRTRTPPPRVAAGSPTGDGGGTTTDPAPQPVEERAFTAIEVRDGHIILQWIGQGTLEISDRIDGPWLAVPDARSPFAIPITGPSGFYRLRP